MNLIKKLFILSLPLLIAACAGTVRTPHMQFSHQAALQQSYAQRGSIKIKKFIDYRPMYERMYEGADVEDNLLTRVTSAYAKPGAAQYLNTVLRQEMQRTGIFAMASENSEPHYELSGIIYNLATGTATEGAENNVFSQPTQSGQAAQSYYFARIKFLAVLRRNNKVVMRRVFHIEKRLPMDQKMGVREQSRWLDSAITEAADQLLTALNKRLQRQRNPA